MRITIQTNDKRQVIDITDQVSGALPAGNGIVNVFVMHTTAAVTTSDLDPGTDLDLLDFLDAIVPAVKWLHPHNPAHAPDHLLSTLLGPDVSVPFIDGKLQLGTWQRIILMELDGPRERSIIVTPLVAS